MKHIGFFTQLQRTFYAKKKKGSIMTRKNPFGTKVFIHIYHYSATFCSCN